MTILLKGIPASVGQAKGPVRIIKTASDLDKFREGEILVAKFTDPTMTIAMNKARAMVTDIGGITSHTAIVAREMGIPCVVATKNATSILTDGRVVIVNGTKGEILSAEDTSSEQEVSAAPINLIAEVQDDSEELNIDRLLDVFTSGLMAMDPKTALPFWDYDFGPIFGDLWIKKMLKAIKKAKEMKLTPKELKELFPGPSVPRKELIYSLIDLKVGVIPKEKRLEFCEFWWDIVKEFTVEDRMASKSNKIHSTKEIDELVKVIKWENGTQVKGRACGQIITCLESLSYGLYSDIFPQFAAENYGPYDVSKHFGDVAILLIKRFSNLKPVELWPHAEDYRYESVYIYSVYSNMDCTIDIYNHQVYSGNTAERLIAYAVVTNQSKFENSLEEMQAIKNYLEPISVEQYKRYHELGFEETKAKWVLQRSYLFKNFFERIGMDWNDEEMLQRVKDKRLLKEPFWDFRYPKEKLLEFYKKVLDPRLDTYYENWKEIWKTTVSTR